MHDWPHQLYGVSETQKLIQLGTRRICLTSPTGGGKTHMICALVKWFLDNGKRCVVYTNRRLLIEQLSTVLKRAGLAHGIRAAGHYSDHSERLQISSIQTEHSRVMKRELMELHQADLAVIDECHLMTNPMAIAIIDRHFDQGSVILGVTATPIELDGIYHELVQAGKNSELRACGALVPAHHYGPTEPDLSHIGKVTLGEDLTETQNVKAIMCPGIFGHVYQHWKRLNPEQKPTILFAPGVAESVWFAEQFYAQGVPSAHIDGEEVWINGVVKHTTTELRREILDSSRTAGIKILCNRFVLREGIDCPWLNHGIFATVLGTLQSYLQSGGRLLRAYPGLEYVVIQDHGGNWHKHGSLNADREWRLSDTAHVIAGTRAERLRNAVDRPGDGPKEPILCPACKRVLATWKCPCGFVIDPRKKSRPVMMADGELREVPGDVFKPRKTQNRPNTPLLWTKAYFRARNAKKGMTFNQALGLFCHEHGYYPPPTLRGMPKEPEDMFRFVKDVPTERLHS